MTDLVIQSASHAHLADKVYFVTAKVALTLPKRSLEVSLPARSLDLTLPARVRTFHLPDLPTRAGNVIGGSIVIQSAVHVHLADSLALLPPNTLQISEGAHDHTVDVLILTSEVP